LRRWGSGLFVAASAIPATSVAQVAVMPQTVIDDHLKSLDAFPRQPFKAESGVKLLAWKTLGSINCDCELLGELGNPRIEKFYRSLLAESFFLMPRIPSPKTASGLSRFQISCRNVVARRQKFLGDSICWEDYKSLSGVPLPPSRYPLTIGFQFSGEKLVAIRIHSNAPNFKAAISSFQVSRK
jgi:hypothetical protein